MALQDLVYVQSYKPTYFIAGYPGAKIQLSFKAELLKSSGFYLAYSQLMIWDIYKTSAPFKDLNYNPELFYRITLDDKDRVGWDFGIYEHESNGRDGSASRSWDRIYVRYRDVYSINHDYHLLWNAKLWFPFNMDESNKNLPEYRGIWEINLSLTNIFGETFDESDLILRLYPGGKLYINPIAGGQELTLRMKRKVRKLLLPVVVQFFHGYGEYLLEYNNDHVGLRVGFGF